MQRDHANAERKAPRAWHPFVWAAYPVIWLYSENIQEAWLTEVVWPLAAALVLTALLWRGLRGEMPVPSRRAVFVAPLTLIVIGYGHIEEGTRRLLLLTPLGGWFDDLTLMLSVVMLGGLVLLLRTLRDGPALPATTRFLNIAAILCIGMALIQAAPARLTADEPAVDAVAHTTSTTNQPDIFLIMLDAYAGLDRLDEFYGVDNRPFIEALESRGFYVANQAHGNYQWTALCMASLLNMRFILEPEEGPRVVPVTWDKSAHGMRPAFLNNRVCAELRARGYRVVAFETPQSGIQLHTADEYLSPGRALSEFQRACLDATLPMALFRDAGVPIERYLNDAHRRRRIHFIFDTLKTLGGAEQPSLVLAHVMAPHAPFVFNHDGSPNNRPREVDADSYRDAYAEQLLYINRLVLETVDAIQARVPDAVIIVQSDHGARLSTIRSRDRAEYAREYLSALNAVYMPGGIGYETLSPGFSQVNTFRYVINTLFDEHLPYQPDMSYLEDSTVDGVFVPVVWDGYTPRFPDLDTESPAAPWTPE